MSRLLVLFFVCLALTVDGKLFPQEARNMMHGTPARKGESVWPKPSSHRTGPRVMALDPDAFTVKIYSSLNICERDIIEKLFVRYKSIIFPPEPLDPSKPDSSLELMKVLRFKLSIDDQGRKIYGNLNDCLKDYYPSYGDTETETCNLINLIYYEFFEKTLSDQYI